MLVSTSIYKHRHVGLVNVETVPGDGFSASTLFNKHGLMLLGGECGWCSKRFPVTLAQHGWYSVSTRWRYEGKVSKLLNKYGVGVVGTLAWSTFKLYPATVAQLPNHSTYTGLAWSARWRGQRINGALLRWHNGRSNMHRASLSVVNTAHCPATTSVALMWVSAEGWLRSIYVLHT